MPITQPTIDDFSDTTVMRVIRKVVNYLVTLIPKVNEEIANVTDSAGERLDTVEANVEALNKELPTDIRVNYAPSTGNFNIDYVKEDGDVLTSNTVVIVSGTTGEVTIVQNTSGISINGTALQSATTAQPGLMTPALVSSLNNVNDTTNDHTTMINAQAEAITALDDRVDALEQAGGGSSVVSQFFTDYDWTELTLGWSGSGFGTININLDNALEYDVISFVASNEDGPAYIYRTSLCEIIDLKPFKEAHDKSVKYSKMFNLWIRSGFNQTIVLLNLVADTAYTNLAFYHSSNVVFTSYGFPTIKYDGTSGAFDVNNTVKIFAGKKKA